jgi:hypothetical protein
MRNPQLKAMKNAGGFPVTVDADSRYTAPYSRKECLWYGSLYVTQESRESKKHMRGERSAADILYVRTDRGVIELFLKDLNPYLSPSFAGPLIIDDKEVYVEEYILEANRQYHAEVTSFRTRLPPLLFIPRSYRIYLLNLYDECPIEGKPLSPLVPTFRGRTG